MDRKTLLRRARIGLWRYGLRLEQALLPRRCIYCGVALRRKEQVGCVSCDRDLPWIWHACRYCGQPLPAPAAPGVPCGRCQASSPGLVSTVAPLHYEFPVDAVIKGLKFHKKLHYQPALSAVLLRSTGQLPADVDAILPVPLHRWRRVRRGFNQADLLARPLARRLGLKVLTEIVRARSTPYQSGLSARARRSNLKSAFRVTGRIDAEHVLIVDDVITTGETCRQLARVLHAAGVQQVSALAVARATVD